MSLFHQIVAFVGQTGRRLFPSMFLVRGGMGLPR